ncbi:MAG: T9SS type A sorting domain-containing protein [Bacteroidia bacterium]
MKNSIKNFVSPKVGVILIVLLFSSNLLAQKNCDNHTTGLVPIMDLAGKQYRGFTGGKYSTGNSRPTLQLNRAITQAQKIKPLDTAGIENQINGKIIFAAVGASNPATEFNKLIEHCDTFKKINKKVRLFNTCVGGTGIQKMNEASDNYWIQANKKLKDSGYSAKQVQVVWVEQENTQNPDTAFPSAALGLMADYQKLLSVIYQKFPNVKIVYINQRAFAGYVDVTPGVIGKGLHFPRDYYNGWCIKWLIEKQINNESGYKFPSELPFIDWATSFWADGKNARSDGLSYDCNTDYGGDGLHLSEQGERKAGVILFNYFKNDTVSKYWFYQPASTSYIQESELDVIYIYPNPTNSELNIGSETSGKIVITNTHGQIIFSNNSYEFNHKLNVSLWAPGIYLVRFITPNGQTYIKKIIVN